MTVRAAMKPQASRSSRGDTLADSSGRKRHPVHGRRRLPGFHVGFAGGCGQSEVDGLPIIERWIACPGAEFAALHPADGMALLY
jgi:hypothetical protein